MISLNYHIDDNDNCIYDMTCYFVMVTVFQVYLHEPTGKVDFLYVP